MTQAQAASNAKSESIPALLPEAGRGYQFVCYADSCSGVPGALHEATFAAVNAIVARLCPPPEFICFPGDEISGLTADREVLRQQWQHWLTHEMAWLDRQVTPLYHTTGNHTTYDAASEAVFREVLAHLPQNGPPDQVGLSYFVRRQDLLLVFINTLWSGLGGEGYVETTWLEQTLCTHADARYKLVVGHHPVYPVNGFSGPYQRELGPAQGQQLWQLFVQHGVLAYLCSHILAFDVQVHAGVLQILTAGAGTAHRMPEEIEYLHCVQLALDEQGVRYQVLDTTAQIREWLSWPPVVPPSETWASLAAGVNLAPSFEHEAGPVSAARLIIWQFSGRCSAPNDGRPQTLLSGWDSGWGLAPLWIGLRGQEQRLSILLSPTPGRSPHLWQGPQIEAQTSFSVQLAIHTGMGPGGLLWRWHAGQPWSSCLAASPWGAERLVWPAYWSIGHAQHGPADRPFRGEELQVRWHTQLVQLA